MATCHHCGALLAGAAFPERCKFCEAVNHAPPTEVEVAVPIQVIHNVVQVTDAGAAARHERKCPHCLKRLDTVRLEDIELSGCGRCGGIWLDNASAKYLVARPQRLVIDLANRASANASQGLKPRSPNPACPVCSTSLERLRKFGIDLDLCNDHGTWFDSYELQNMTRRLLNIEPAYATPTSGSHCSSCHAMIDPGRANIGGDGPICDECWRRHQLALLDEADRNHKSAAVAVTGALLLGALGAGFATSRRD